MASSRKSPKNSALPERVAAVLKRQVRRGDRLIVGLSGGVDSVVLLDLLNRAARDHGFTLTAVHINHQINPAAASWATFCRRLCRRLGVPLIVKKVELVRGNSLEANARAARYAVYAQARGDAVVLAHNLDDQAETVLLQLLRGAGVKGVSAMPEFRIDKRGSAGASAGSKGKSEFAILRPLLEVPRSEIEAYARMRKLTWVEDDSNLDTAYDRNFMRHRVLPLIAERYPAYRQTLLRASRNFSEAAELAERGAAVDSYIDDNSLALAPLRALPPLRLKNVLRHFLAGHGVVMPNARRLEECARQIAQARQGARLAIRLGALDLRSHGGFLRLVPLAGAVTADKEFERVWRGEKRWQLPELGGMLAMVATRGDGIRAELLRGHAVVVRRRRGGERLRPDAQRPRRTLKNLLQEHGVPEWQREGLPLIYVDGVLACVPGVAIEAAFQAPAGAPAMRPEWRPIEA
jgi:tRNA(Ile)-lysidine synthase